MTPAAVLGPCSCGQVQLLGWSEHRMVSDGSCHARRVCFEAAR